MHRFTPCGGSRSSGDPDVHAVLPEAQVAPAIVLGVDDTSRVPGMVAMAAQAAEEGYAISTPRVGPPSGSARRTAAAQAA